MNYISANLSNNTQKYLDLAKTTKVVIRTDSEDEIPLPGQQPLAPDENLARGISGTELLKRFREKLRQELEK